MTENMHRFIKETLDIDNNLSVKYEVRKRHAKYEKNRMNTKAKRRR